MRTISRLIAGLCVLGSAACASDGILAPQIQPESDALAAVAPAEPAAEPAATATATTAPRYIIRCGGSISPQTDDPLYVIDGVIQATTPVDLEAVDIETIEVLRGANPAALYGTRAVNGVILITTRTATPRRT